MSFMLDGREFPRCSNAAASAVRDKRHARDVIAAYYTPDIRHRCDSHTWPDREIRIANGVYLVVVDDERDGTVIEIAAWEPPTPGTRSAVLDEVPQPRRRRKGGAGTRYPTTFRELFARAKHLGARVEPSGGGHVRISVAGKRNPVIVAATASDWRAVRNAANQCRNTLGLDLSRRD